MSNIANPPIKASFENFNLFYGKHQVLKNITWNIFEKKLNTLIGPSGCGKSSLLRSMNRMHDLYPDTSWNGHLWLYPDKIDILSKAIDPILVRMRIGMVFQKPNPFPKTIFENVAYGLKIRGIKQTKQLEEMVEQSLKAVNLWNEVKDRLKEHALKLSGGQQQRLCLARSLAVQPEILLLDEPTSALDPLSAEKIEETLNQLKNTTTLVLVTHNLSSAKKNSDYVGLIYHGQLVESGPPDIFFNHPQHELTRLYIEKLADNHP